MLDTRLLEELQRIVDARVVVIDAGEYMGIVRCVPGGYEFMNPDGEWEPEPCELVRLIARVEPGELDCANPSKID